MLEYLNVKCVPCRDQLCCYEQAVRLWLLYLGCISSVSEAEAPVPEMHFNCDAGCCTWVTFFISPTDCYMNCVSSICYAMWLYLEKFQLPLTQVCHVWDAFLLVWEENDDSGRLLDLTCISLFCDANIDRHKGTQLLLGQYFVEFFVKRVRIQDQGSKSE